MKAIPSCYNVLVIKESSLVLIWMFSLEGMELGNKSQDVGQESFPLNISRLNFKA